ncbi:hypothetical protein, partial [Nocardia gipuzkoensis]|uniref:hypothetical protein n=1 Tax=Nocardia gipuzkoensis TaxID=2749991 RepID=UPI002457BC5C
DWLLPIEWRYETQIGVTRRRGLLETGSCAGVVASGGDVGIWVAVPRRDAVAMPCGDLLAGI